MASLTGQTISSSYDSLLKVFDNGPITSSLKTVSDGLGNSSSLQLSSLAAYITGALTITGQLSLGSTITNGTYTYTLPSATGTLALASAFSSYVPTSRQLTINGTAYDLSADRTWSVGTVTSVAALTLGTSGSDLSSTVENSTTTPVITLNVPNASATARGVITTGTQTIGGTKTFTGLLTVGDGTTSSILANSATSVNAKILILKSAVSNLTTVLDIRATGTSTDLPGIVLKDNESGTSGSNIMLIGRGNATLPSTGVSYVGNIVQGTINADSNHFGFLLSNTSAGRFEAMRMFNTGNVIIQSGGTYSDAGFKLDVNGTGRFTGQLRLGSTITNGTYTYTLPSATGTLALTSALSSYLPLAGGTLTGALSGTSATFISTNAAGTLGVYASASGQGLMINPNNTAGTVNVYSDYLGGSEPKLHLSTYADRVSANGITIHSGGNVGIGTTTPTSKLEIVGGALNTNSANYSLGISSGLLTGRLGSYVAASILSTYFDNSSIEISAGSSSANIVGISMNAGGESNNPNTVRLYTAGSERLRITPGGNVGIGTTAPSASDSSSVTLQLKNTVVLQNVIGIQALFSNNAYYDGAWKRISSSGGAAVAAIRINADSGQSGISFHVAGSGSAGSTITNWDTSDNKMRINESGNVLIGTTTDAGYKLDVNGTGRFSSSVTAPTAIINARLNIPTVAPASPVPGDLWMVVI